MEKKVYHITEKNQYMPPSSMDLIAIADSIGTRLMGIYTELENVKSAYPESANQINSFIDGTIIPETNKIKSIIQKEIPDLERTTLAKYKGDVSSYRDLKYSVKTVKDKETLDVLIKLKGIDKVVSDLEKKADAIRKSSTDQFQPFAASKSLEDSVQKIINKVRDGINRQAEQNIRNKKRGDIIAGTTKLDDKSKTLAAGTNTSNSQSQSQSQSQSDAAKARKRKNIDDISAYLAKKYSEK